MNFGSIEEENEEVKIDAELTKMSVEKIVEDFRNSLKSNLKALGMDSNAEKHINELVHRANFRFSDLESINNMCMNELHNCDQLKNIIQSTLTEQMADQEADEEEKAEIIQNQSQLKKLDRRIKICDKSMKKNIGLSKQTYTKNPHDLQRKKSLQNASTRIKSSNATFIELLSLKEELEKILSAAASGDFGELKLAQWEDFDRQMSDHLQQIKDEINTLISSSAAYLKEDRTETQTEIMKVANEAKMLR